jgi:hypothetical protein
MSVPRLLRIVVLVALAALVSELGPFVSAAHSSRQLRAGRSLTLNPA